MSSHFIAIFRRVGIVVVYKAVEKFTCVAVNGTAFQSTTVGDSDTFRCGILQINRSATATITVLEDAIVDSTPNGCNGTSGIVAHTVLEGAVADVDVFRIYGSTVGVAVRRV